MQAQLGINLVRILINMIDPLRVKRGGTAFYAVHFITFIEQKFRKIGPVLTSYTCNQCAFAHISIIPF